MVPGLEVLDTIDEFHIPPSWYASQNFLKAGSFEQ